MMIRRDILSGVRISRALLAYAQDLRDSDSGPGVLMRRRVLPIGGGRLHCAVRRSTGPVVQRGCVCS